MREIILHSLPTEEDESRYNKGATSKRFDRMSSWNWKQHRPPPPSKNQFLLLEAPQAGAAGLLPSMARRWWSLIPVDSFPAEEETIVDI